MPAPKTITTEEADRIFIYLAGIHTEREGLKKGTRDTLFFISS